MRLFVLGATGRTGREFADQALTRGHEVTAFVRSPQKIGHRPVTILGESARSTVRAMHETGVSRLMTEHYRVKGGHLPPWGFSISRADLVHFMVEEVEHPRYARAIVGVSR